MKESLTLDNVREMMLKLADDLIAAQEELIQLDSAIGDGDLGITMTIGMKAVQAAIAKSPGDDIADLLLNCSDSFSEKAASTFGTLFTIMLKGASKAARGSERVATPEAAAMFRAAVDGVMHRGKAQVGEKTLLDALVPATESLEKSAQAGESLPQAAKAALLEAQKGSDATVDMRAKAGRSGYLGDRTIGQRDPGAAAIVMIMASFTRYITEE